MDLGEGVRRLLGNRSQLVRYSHLLPRGAITESLAPLDVVQYVNMAFAVPSALGAYLVGDGVGPKAGPGRAWICQRKPAQAAGLLRLVYALSRAISDGLQRPVHRRFLLAASAVRSRAPSSSSKCGVQRRRHPFISLPIATAVALTRRLPSRSARCSPRSRFNLLHAPPCAIIACSPPGAAFLLDGRRDRAGRGVLANTRLVPRARRRPLIRDRHVLGSSGNCMAGSTRRGDATYNTTSSAGLSDRAPSWYSVLPRAATATSGSPLGTPASPWQWSS